MALQFFMRLTGDTQGEIKGASAQTGHEEEITCHALDQKIYRPFDKLSGQPTGARIHGPLTITKSFDPSSPLLYQALCTGERLTEVYLEFYRISPAGIEEKYFTIRMDQATIVEIAPRMEIVFDSEMQRYDHLENISFAYARIEWTWEPSGISAMDEFRT